MPGRRRPILPLSMLLPLLEFPKICTPNLRVSVAGISRRILLRTERLFVSPFYLRYYDVVTLGQDIRQGFGSFVRAESSSFLEIRAERYHIRNFGVASPTAISSIGIFTTSTDSSTLGCHIYLRAVYYQCAAFFYSFFEFGERALLIAITHFGFVTTGEGIGWSEMTTMQLDAPPGLPRHTRA